MKSRRMVAVANAVHTVGIKLCNNQRNAQVFVIHFLIYFCLTYFGLSLSPSSRGTVYKSDSGSSFLGMVSASGPGCNLARSLTPYPADLNHCQIYTPASEDGLKESPKYVRQK
jgi:hypothetical protein